MPERDSHLAPGVAGAELSVRVLLILGFANLLADGFSMAAANFLSTKTEQDQYLHFQTQQKENIKTDPKQYIEPIKRHFQHEGLQGELLEQAVTATISKPDNRHAIFVGSEFGKTVTRRSAWKSSISTFVSFLLFGFVPLVPFVLGLPRSFYTASVMTALMFVLIGSLRSRWSSRQWWQSGLVTLFVGGIAALLAFVVGALLHQVIG